MTNQALTDMQLVLLATAIQRDNGSLMPSHNLADAQGDRINAAVADLIERGFAAEQETSNLSERWRRDGDILLGIFITDAGRAAVEGADVSTPAKSRASKPVLSKAESVRKLLARSRGATMAEIAKATDWQPHTIRAFLSGVRHKTGPLVRELRRSGEQAYRLVTAATERAA